MRLLKISSLVLSLAATLGVVPAFGSTCSNASLNGVFGFIKPDMIVPESMAQVSVRSLTMAKARSAEHLHTVIPGPFQCSPLRALTEFRRTAPAALWRHNRTA